MSTITFFALARGWAITSVRRVTGRRKPLIDVASTVPNAINVAGSLLSGWSLATCILLAQLGNQVGLYNGIKPLLNKTRS